MVITVLGMIEEITILGYTLKFRAVDAMVVFAFLGPAFGTYAIRRYTDKISKS